MIADARRDGVITERQFRMADSVTFFGNKGAHPKDDDDDLNEVDQPQAEVGLQVARELLVALFPPDPEQAGLRPPILRSGTGLTEF